MCSLSFPQEVQSQLSNANSLLEKLSSQRQRWNEQLKAIQSIIDSVPGHALLCAASVCYLSQIPPDKHRELAANWLGYCSGSVALGSLALPEQQKLQSSQPHHRLAGQQQVLKIESSFAVQNTLSTKDERSVWEQNSIFPDECTMERCLAARSCCTEGDSWPLIIDPHSQFCNYFEALEPIEKPSSTEQMKLRDDLRAHVKANSSVGGTSKPEQLVHIRTCMSDPRSAIILREALSSGGPALLVIDSTPEQEVAFVQKLVQRQFAKNPTTGEIALELDNTALRVHPCFRLYLTVECPLNHALATCLSFLRDLSRVLVIDLSFRGTVLQNYIKGFVLQHERPEFGVRHRSLLADLALHQRQTEQTQVLIVHSSIRT